MRWTLHTALNLTLFRSNPLFFGHLSLFKKSEPLPLNFEKTDEKLVNEFLWHGIHCRISIKIFFA